MKKKASKFVLLLSALGIAFSVFFCPVSSVPAQAQTEESTVMPLSDDIRWRYVVKNNALFKRQYNYTTQEWLGTWVLVRYLDE